VRSSSGCAALLAERYRVVVAADGAGSADRLAASFAAAGVHLTAHRGADGSPPDLTAAGGHVVVAASSGASSSPGQAGGARRVRRHRAAAGRTGRPVPASGSQPGFFEDLTKGDHVVHVHHGVGRYGGMVKRAIGGVERDYLLLEYRGGDKLYVPSTRSTRCATTPAASRPPSTASAAPSGARPRPGQERHPGDRPELVVLYQRRVNAPGHAFSPDTPWQHELEEAFPFRETPDQEKAIAEVKADMEADRPMDRSCAATSGFGKTEVAIRAAFKAVQDGLQVAVLVPTTLLAQQHFQTFSERFAGYPVRVEVLSRFLTDAQARAVIKGVQAGEVDVVIGTHRLLGKDITIPKLGLLVVDEEQRFGVTHKEAMKQLKADVDVLTLSATPIPRTLEMSLTGIRTSRCSTRRRPSASRSSPTSVSTTSAPWPRPSAASCCARARSSSCTTGCRTSSRWPARSARSCPRPGSPSPTASWTRAPSRRSSSTSGRAASTSSCARRSSSRASTCRR
jgi:transcription-repair coupling factor (superfamily II helicase)